MLLSRYLHMRGRGSQVELATKLQISPQAVNSWLRGKKISAETAVKIFFLTDGEVGLSDMRPDVFPHGYIFTQQKNV